MKFPGFESTENITEEQINHRIKELNEEHPCPDKVSIETIKYLEAIIPAVFVLLLYLVMIKKHTFFTNTYVVFTISIIVIFLQEVTFWIDELRFNPSHDCPIKLPKTACNDSVLMFSFFNSFFSCFSLYLLLTSVVKSKSSFFIMSICVVIFLLSCVVKFVVYYSQKPIVLPPRIRYIKEENIFILDDSDDKDFNHLVLGNPRLRRSVAIAIAVMDTILLLVTLIIESTDTRILNIKNPITLLFKLFSNFFQKMIADMKTLPDILLSLLKITSVFFPIIFDYVRLSEPFESSQVSSNLKCYTS
jgi:hypothetical protein